MTLDTPTGCGHGIILGDKCAECGATVPETFPIIDWRERLDAAESELRETREALERAVRLLEAVERQQFKVWLDVRPAIKELTAFLSRLPTEDRLEQAFTRAMNAAIDPDGTVLPTLPHDVARLPTEEEN